MNIDAGVVLKHFCSTQNLRKPRLSEPAFIEAYVNYLERFFSYDEQVGYMHDLVYRVQGIEKPLTASLPFSF